MANRARARLGARTIAALVLSGAAVGFAVPALASSLIRQERHQPHVRLLPAPRIPRGAAPSVQPETTVPGSAPITIQRRRLRVLTPAQLERKTPRPQSRLAGAPEVRRQAGPIATPSPTVRTSPATTAPKHGPKASTTVPVGTSGGSKGPE
jgi:hypothetical protein